LSDILIVEDNEAMSRIYAEALEFHGHKVRVALDEQNLREELARGLPDLLLLDVGLPGVDGLEILRRLRQEPETSDLKVAMLSNYADRKIVHQALRLDALEFVEKSSITPSRLADQVARWLYRSRRSSAGSLRTTSAPRHR
jgi:CheY-like chemotaxis protein